MLLQLATSTGRRVAVSDRVITAGTRLLFGVRRCDGAGAGECLSSLAALVANHLPFSV